MKYMAPGAAEGAASVTEPLSCQSAAFSLPLDLHYLNCAYLGPLPRTAQQAAIPAIARKANPTTIAPADFFSDSDEARRLFARLINGGDGSRVALIPSVSYGVATVVHNTPIATDQNLVFVGEDFPSDVHAWRKAAAAAGASVRVISPPDGACRGERWNAQVLDAIDGRTAVVAVPHVHWTDGTRFDLTAIGRAARKVGAVFIVDGTQSVGALPCDVAEIQPDALICAGYKWLLGPYSTALAYFGPRYDGGEPIEENWIARKGSDDFRRLAEYENEYAAGAVRYDGGQRSNFILLPMLIAAMRFVLDAAPERIQEYCRRLVREPLARARELGFAVEDERWRAAHLFGLRVPPGLDATRLSQTLKANNVFVSLRGSAVRVSPNVYNNEDDMAALVDALAAAAGGVA
jgi:selenocysteine lyase/cysteine desulfurase